MKAIETFYDGYRFRSRLEARYAVFFKTLGIEYRYEPEGFDLDGVWYLPDFFLPEQQCWFEVKGEKPTFEEHEKALLLANESQKDVYLAQGDIEPGMPTTCYYHTCFPLLTSVPRAPECFFFVAPPPTDSVDLLSAPGGLHLLHHPSSALLRFLVRLREADLAFTFLGDAVFIVGENPPLALQYQAQLEPLQKELITLFENYKEPCHGFLWFIVTHLTAPLHGASYPYRLPLFSNRSRLLIESACTAARQARFEHGEHGTQ